MNYRYKVVGNCWCSGMSYKFWFRVTGRAGAYLEGELDVNELQGFRCNRRGA